MLAAVPGTANTLGLDSADAKAAGLIHRRPPCFCTRELPSRARMVVRRNREILPPSPISGQGPAFQSKGSIMAVSVNDIFKPGQICEASGIYRVTHDPYHALSHEVTCVFGKPFPPCRGCHHPRFQLVKAAQHIEQNEHFK